MLAERADTFAVSDPTSIHYPVIGVVAPSIPFMESATAVPGETRWLR